MYECDDGAHVHLTDRGVAEEDKRGEPEDEGSARHHPQDARDAAQGDDHEGRPLQGQHHLARQQGALSLIGYTHYDLCGTGYVGRYQNSGTFSKSVCMYVCLCVCGGTISNI